MHPEIHINYLSVLVAVVTSFFFSFLWYGLFFGKCWTRLMAMPTNGKLETNIMLRGVVLMIVGTFFTCYVMAYASEVWRPSVWGVEQDASSCIYGFFNGFFTWVGFLSPCS